MSHKKGKVSLSFFIFYVGISIVIQKHVMNKNLVIAATMLTGVLGYFLLRKKYGDPEKYLRYDLTPNNHHVTKAFSNTKKDAMDGEG